MKLFKKYRHLNYEEITKPKCSPEIQVLFDGLRKEIFKLKYPSKYSSGQSVMYKGTECIIKLVFFSESDAPILNPYHWEYSIFNIDGNLGRVTEYQLKPIHATIVAVATPDTLRFPQRLVLKKLDKAFDRIWQLENPCKFERLDKVRFDTSEYVISDIKLDSQLNNRDIRFWLCTLTSKDETIRIRESQLIKIK